MENFFRCDLNLSNVSISMDSLHTFKDYISREILKPTIMSKSWIVRCVLLYKNIKEWRIPVWWLVNVGVLLIWDGIPDRGMGFPDGRWGTKKGMGYKIGDEVPDRGWGTRQGDGVPDRGPHHHLTPCPSSGPSAVWPNFFSFDNYKHLIKNNWEKFELILNLAHFHHVFGVP